MRCDDRIYGSLFNYIDLYIDLEKRVRVDHPLRVIRQIANAALKLLSGEFAKLYSPIGRESVPPERLMHVLVAARFYSILSERQFVELFRWARHRGRGVDATSFTESRPAVGW
jgi:transposase